MSTENEQNNEEQGNQKPVRRPKRTRAQIELEKAERAKAAYETAVKAAGLKVATASHAKLKQALEELRQFPRFSQSPEFEDLESVVYRIGLVISAGDF